MKVYSKSLHDSTNAMPRPQRLARGFSLVEVVMAVAIAALGIITVLGLIPGSLASIREASEITSRSRIIAAISSDIQMADWGANTGGTGTWSGVDAFLIRKWSFDDQANLLSEGDGDLASQQAYLARVRRPEQQVTLSGQTGLNPDLINLYVDIATVNDPGFGFETEAAVFSYPIIVSRRYSTGN
jgi:uncharacterized protein (TIGR02598 family)